MTDSRFGRSLALDTYHPKPQREKRYHRFGYNLGFGLKPGMKKYGASGQGALAQAIKFGADPADRHFKVPKSSEMKRAASEFLMYNQRLFKGGKDDPLAIADYPRKGGVIHHSLLDKTWADTYRFQVIHGTRKVIDPSARATIAKIKEEIKYANTPKERRLFKEMLKELQNKAKTQAWKLEAEKAGVIKKTANPALKKLRSEYESTIKERNISIIKMQMAKLDIKDEIMFDKTYDGADPGVRIGSGRDMKKIESDLYRLLAYLKRARWIRGAVFDGIMNRRAVRARHFLRTHAPDLFREMFLSHNARLKYATDAPYIPGEEYGYKKKKYDNTKGVLSPLQRLRTFDKSGKEYIRSED